MADTSEIEQAWAIISTLCGWHVTPAKQETMVVDSLGDPIVFLPTKHVTEVIEVKVDGVVVDPTGYSFSQDGMLHFTHKIRPGFRTVEATIIHGYQSAPDIEALVDRLASRASKPAESYSVGGISVGAPGSLMPQSTEWRIIDQYKLGPMP